MIVHTSESSKSFAGISVPGTPCVMMLKMAASLEP
jgi:hypothetical protein